MKINFVDSPRFNRVLFNKGENLLDQAQLFPRRTHMDKVETLQKIKHAESQIKTMREAAERERETALRDARRQALELLDQFREQAEARYREIVAAAETAVAAERERMLGAAREEAARMTARGKANVDKAVELVLAKFRGAIRA